MLVTLSKKEYTDIYKKNFEEIVQYNHKYSKIDETLITSYINKHYPSQNIIEIVPQYYYDSDGETGITNYGIKYFNGFKIYCLEKYNNEKT